MHDHSMHQNHNHEHHEEGRPRDYFVFGLIILGILLISYWLGNGWSMRHFMAVFFLAFGFFKVLDIPGFVSSYRAYDIIAKKFAGYAYAYPFIELLLGIGYLMDISWINWLTLALMIVGSIGVGKELLRGSKIKCACLGTFVKLPLTTVSLIEDVSMGIMALIVILT